MRLFGALIGILLMVPGWAIAQDDFDDFDDFEDFEDLDDDIDALGEESEADYEALKESARKMDAQDEMAIWEKYLRDYPESIFYEEIEDRLKELGDRLYDMDDDPIGDDDEDVIHAKDAELDIVQPHAFFGANPRRGFKVMLRIGFGGYLAYRLEYEHAIKRNFSVFGNLHSRDPSPSGVGANLEVGARYAIVKSVNRGVVLSLGGAVRVGFDPGVRAGFIPFIALGLKPVDIVQFQFFFGPDFAFTPANTPIYRIGALGAVRFSKAVGLSVEADLKAKSKAWPESNFGVPAEKGTNSFFFGEAAVGLMIYPWQDKRSGDDRMNLRLGVSIPFAGVYWQDYTPMGVDLGLRINF